MNVSFNIWSWMVIPHCPIIGSLESSMVGCMPNLKFDSLELGIMITHWNWDVIMHYHFLSSSIWRSEEKRVKKESKFQYWPPKFGMWEGFIGCAAKLATCGLSINN